MRLVNVQGRAGIAVGDGVVDVAHRSNDRFPADPMAALAVWDALGAWAEGLRDGDAERALDDRVLGPPVPRPRQVFAIGMNYRAHAHEAGLDIPRTQRSAAGVGSRMSAGTTGIVRTARRPRGWRAPGPPPLAPADRPELWPARDEDLCYLAGDWRILQRLDGHRWSLDDLVTAWWAARSVDGDPPRLVDLGCGIGSVLLLLAWRFPAARCVGIEAQAVSVALAQRSIAWNGVAARCEVRRGDLRDPAIARETGAFALVTGTPPYLPAGSAVEATRVQRGPCRIERRGGIEAYCAAAARLLAPGAPFVVCAAAGQQVRVTVAAAAAGLAITTRLDVVPRLGKAPLFAVYTMQRGGEHRSPRVLPALVVRDGEGRRTAAFRAVRAEMGMPP